MPSYNSPSGLQTLCLAVVGRCLFSYGTAIIQRFLQLTHFKGYSCLKIAGEEVTEFIHFLESDNLKIKFLTFYSLMPTYFHDGIGQHYILIFLREFNIKFYLHNHEDYVERNIHLLTCHSLYLFKYIITEDLNTIDLTSLTHCFKDVALFVHNKHHPYSEDLPSHFNDLLINIFSCKKTVFKNLKYLKIPHFVGNTLVGYIGHFCPSLEVLILRCSFDCSDFTLDGKSEVIDTLPTLYGESVEYSDFAVIVVEKPAGCRYLQILHLPQIPESTTAEIEEIGFKILFYMTDLVELIGLPLLYLFVDYKYFQRIYSGRSFALNIFHHGAYNKFQWPYYVYEDADLDVVDDFRTLLPNIKEVVLYAPSHHIQKVLINYDSLESVMLFSVEFRTVEPYLRNLLKIDINVGYEDEWPILISLCQSCPQLEDLTFRSFSLQTQEENMTLPIYPFLRNLKFIGQQCWNKTALLGITLGSPNLVSLCFYLKASDELELFLDDDTVQKIAESHQLLEKFMYKVDNFFEIDVSTNSQVTIITAYTLIKNCPHISKIGYLDSFSVQNFEKLSLMNEIRINNWDLEIK